VSDPNIHDPEWEVDYRDTPVRMRGVRVGAAAGSKSLGASLYEVEPGGAVAPYHLHHGNEELAIVVSGAPLLRTPEGTRRLTAGAVVAFLPGPDGAHRLSNPGPDTVRVLLVSTMNFPEVAEHVTTGTTMAMTGPAEGKIFPAGTDQDFLTLYQQAIAADAEHDEAGGE
jgi:uncharacterized cupin superfamily protein